MYYNLINIKITNLILFYLFFIDLIMQLISNNIELKNCNADNNYVVIVPTLYASIFKTIDLIQFETTKQIMQA